MEDFDNLVDFNVSLSSSPHDKVPLWVNGVLLTLSDNTTILILSVMCVWNNPFLIIQPMFPFGTSQILLPHLVLYF